MSNKKLMAASAIPTGLRWLEAWARADVVEGELDEVYRRFAPLIHRRCRTLLGDEQEALDATHDIFLKLTRELRRFRGDSELVTWIWRISTNHCLNTLRSRRARLRFITRSEQLVEPSVDPRQRIERRELLRVLLQRLTQRQVQIAVHWHLDELTQPEIAKLLGISERTVRSELRKIDACALAERRLLADQEEER